MAFRRLGDWFARYVGIGGATGDASNPLSVRGSGSLFDGDTGGHQIRINKSAAGDTVSLLFQTGFSGRAEFGTLGSDNFGLKVSANGAGWFSALECSRTNGRVSFPAGISGHIPVYDTGNSVFLGEDAGANDDLSTNHNVFIGHVTGRTNTTGYNNSVTGAYAMYSNTTGYNNSVTGASAMYSNTTGHNNCAVGYAALYSNTTGHNNCAVGRLALRRRTNGTNNTNFNNCSGLGYDTRVSASNQVQLGNSSCTTYVYGAVQNRSDVRDKADIRDTVLGLDFITKLRPVDFRWDMRDDYFDRAEEKDPETGEMAEKLVPSKKDGSRKRKRFHHGLIAQEVEAVLKKTGVDFGGFQNHALGGGDDVMSIGYTELVAPLIKAVQELAARVDALENKHKS